MCNEESSIALEQACGRRESGKCPLLKVIKTYSENFKALLCLRIVTHRTREKRYQTSSLRNTRLIDNAVGL